MTSFVCPCCGENYHVNAEVQVGRKVFCGKCQMKHIYYNYSLVPFAVELSPRGGERRIACPFCQHHFLVDRFNFGEYCCIHCGTHFYVAQKPEVFAPGVKDGEAVFAPELPDAPAPEVDVTKLQPEAFTGCATEPLLEIPLELPAAAEVECKKSSPVKSGSRIVDSSAVTIKITDSSDFAVSREFPAENNITANVPEISPEARAREMVKENLRHDNSGLGGLLINIAEKLCGK